MKVNKEQYRVIINALKKLKQEPEDIPWDADFSTWYSWSHQTREKAIAELWKIIEHNEELWLD